jgi:rhodanese-related sulfurtransferase
MNDPLTDTPHGGRPRSVTATDLGALLEGHGDVRVLDVRTPGEFESAHIAGAYNIPLGDLPAALDELREVAGRLVVVCQSGARAGRACDVLAHAGVDGVDVLDGGMAAWQRAGLPVRRTRARWELERQVRLVAGGLVAASIVASIGRPAARFVAGAVGAGLVTAAITNTCAMGRLLSALPYNRPRRPTLPATETARRLRDGIAA